ncbi:hypothetical protein [Stackebrandtia nassauensis]|uniref:Uncharacterized protein n=1 Tax=Stackebrandtia nassauensis (strain DSM 44728 / CIP 108903 / NRRL B-16338 / NBRC 102104 / LLR-40K-21) TaxID=446470 RepID=D3Q3W5_STANL|nr:hypothetical protein [Stackebrandtia nassauensis]ADD44032.1 hypothetical protein Snas_4385 [Stackebrandtia nassauensis DSM 44728]
MKINKNWYRGEASFQPIAVSTFRSRGMAGSAFAVVSRVANACPANAMHQGTSLSTAERIVLLGHDSVQTTTANTALKSRTDKPAGIVQRDGMGAPRGIPPRSKPKWA